MACVVIFQCGAEVGILLCAFLTKLGYTHFYECIKVC